VEAADGGTVKLNVQYQAPGGRMVDDFNNLNWQLNDLNEVVTHNGTLPTNPLEGDLAIIDSHSPHDTKGGVVKWNATTGIYLSKIPSDFHKDVSGFKTFSFRIAQRYDSASNPVNAAQDLYVKLTDTNSKFRSIKVSKFATISYPYVRGYDILIKSALKTVRIPLSVFRIKVLGMDIVDLTQVDSFTFEFKATPTGEIEIDDIEFSAK